MVKQIESKDGENRKVRYVRMSDAEWEWVVAEATRKEMSASALIRSKILRGMAVVNEYHQT